MKLFPFILCIVFFELVHTLEQTQLTLALKTIEEIPQSSPKNCQDFLQPYTQLMK